MFHAVVNVRPEGDNDNEKEATLVLCNALLRKLVEVFDTCTSLAKNREHRACGHLTLSRVQIQMKTP